MRLAGHDLCLDGEAFSVLNCDECCPPGGPLPAVMRDAGHGLCECDAYSAHLNTRTERQVWHREHQAEVAANVP